MEQATGIGPAYPPWQGGVLPLNYACNLRPLLDAWNIIASEKMIRKWQNNHIRFIIPRFLNKEKKHGHIRRLS